jgi:hypothetical protein
VLLLGSGQLLLLLQLEVLAGKGIACVCIKSTSPCTSGAKEVLPEHCAKSSSAMLCGLGCCLVALTVTTATVFAHLYNPHVCQHRHTLACLLFG